MASYTKQMMDAAKAWLAINTDPDSPFITLPRGSPEIESGIERSRSGIARDRDQYRRYLEDNPKAKQNPALMTRLGDLETALQQLDSVNTDLEERLRTVRDMEGQLELTINAEPTQKHVKRESATALDAVLGRWMLSWARHGYNVFDLSPDFTAAMLLTDPTDLDLADVRLPFQGLLLLIPDGFARGREGGHYTKIHLTEIPRSHVKQLGVMKQVEIELSKLTAEQKRTVLREAEAAMSSGSSLCEVRVDRKLTDKVNMSDDPDDLLFDIYATDGVHVLATTIERKGLTWSAFDEIPSEVDFTADVECLSTIRRIVFGALAYTTAIANAVTPIPTENTRGPRRPSDDPTAKRWEVGRTIKIDHQLVRAVRAGAREVAFRLKHRHIVRGHYRNQAHGPKRALRTSKWICPHWRGPEDGAALIHTYKLEPSEPKDGGEP